MWIVYTLNGEIKIINSPVAPIGSKMFLITSDFSKAQEFMNNFVPAVFSCLLEGLASPDPPVMPEIYVNNTGSGLGVWTRLVQGVYRLTNPNDYQTQRFDSNISIQDQGNNYLFSCQVIPDGVQLRCYDATGALIDFEDGTLVLTVYVWPNLA